MTRFSRLLSTFLCVLTLIGTVYADEQEKLENLRRRIADVQQEIEKTSESKSEVADDLKESERAISNINRKLSELSKLQKSADNRLGEFQAQEHVLNRNIAEQRLQLGKLLYQQYLGGRQEHLQLLLSTQEPNQIAMNLQYYRYIASERAKWLSAMRSDLAALGEVRKQAQEKRSELASLQSEHASHKSILVKQKSERQRMLSKISRQLRQQRREIKNLQRNENRLSQLVQKISSMLAQPKSDSLFHNNKLPDNRFDGQPFSKLRGKLSLPVKGTVTNRFNSRRPDSTVLWKGLFLRTSSGQPVKAVASGRVVFADWLRGFGNLLIIDHGDNYMSLYGNNETLYKQVGDELLGGDTIASVGNTGGNEDFGLYFELRHESKPLDPVKWLAKK